MAILLRRSRRLALLILVAIGLYLGWQFFVPTHGDFTSPSGIRFRKSAFDWATVPQAHPVESLKPLPKGQPLDLPRVQFEFASAPQPSISSDELAARRHRVRDAFLKGWKSYERLAWMEDELLPVSGEGKRTFGGWGATVVDAMDTLWMMGLYPEFDRAARAAAAIDWSKTQETSINLFETTIRHLAGLLSAYELSGEVVLLAKAVELGDLLYMGFDTPNRLPPFWLNFRDALKGRQQAGVSESSAAVGSLCMEFTRLSQLTGDPKYFDATDRVKDFFYRTQKESFLPGMWPISINFRREKVDSRQFGLGGRADSLYEYLPKMHALLGGLDPAYPEMALAALDAAKDNLFFRPMANTTERLLFSGRLTIPARSDPTELQLVAEGEHLTCFAGGMYALAGRLFSREDYVDHGEQLTRGCAWAYASFPTGVMPESFRLIDCQTPIADPPCAFNETRWEQEGDRLSGPGFAWVKDTKYLLRPEAIESVFYAYRITGKEEYLETAWTMFQAIETATETPLAHSSIRDVRTGGETVKIDSMESFWFSETLKYFYLIFSPPDFMSLDDYVFNTEAHPFKLPKPRLDTKHG